MSAEPSMEEILSSIKRIIAEEGEVPGRQRRQPRSLPSGVGPGGAALPPLGEEVLELSHPMPQAERISSSVRPASPPVTEPSEPSLARPAPEPSLARPAPEPSLGRPAPPPPAAPPQPAEPDDPIVSRQTADATRGPLEALSRLVTRPEPGGDGTLEAMVREMLRPMLRDWMDAKLPGMVEEMVAREIEKITGTR